MNPDLLRQYLVYYQDLGIKTLYRRDAPVAQNAAQPEPQKGGQPELRDFSDAARGEEGRFAQAPPRDVVRQVASPAASGDGGRRKSWTDQAGAVVAPAAGDAAAARGDGAAEKKCADQAVPLLEQIRTEIGDDCRRCKLHEQRTKMVFGSGNPEAKLVFVGEGPGADEDAQGVPFVGRAGQLLTQMIDNTAKREGIPIERKDVYICNVVKCRPPGNRTPEPDEMEICGQFLLRQLEAIRPKAICVLGATAAKALLNRKEGVTKMRGNWYEWHGIQVMVTYHPSYLLRPYNQEAKREAWEDLKKALHFVYD